MGIKIYKKLWAIKLQSFIQEQLGLFACSTNAAKFTYKIKHSTTALVATWLQSLSLWAVEQLAALWKEINNNKRLFCKIRIYIGGIY